MADDLVGAAQKAAGVLTGKNVVNAVRGALTPAPAKAPPAPGPATPSVARLVTAGAAVGPTVPVVNTQTGNLTKPPWPTGK